MDFRDFAQIAQTPTQTIINGISSDSHEIQKFFSVEFIMIKKRNEQFNDLGNIENVY